MYTYLLLKEEKKYFFQTKNVPVSNVNFINSFILSKLLFTAKRITFYSFILTLGIFFFATTAIPRRTFRNQSGANLRLNWYAKRNYCWIFLVHHAPHMTSSSFWNVPLKLRHAKFFSIFKINSRKTKKFIFSENHARNSNKKNFLVALKI